MKTKKEENIKKNRKVIKINKETLTNQVAILIREAIVSGEFAPGSMISLRDLSKKWKISRTPLREAARKIEAEGLIISIPRKGFMVKMFNIESVKEVYVVRESLEVLAAKLACRNISSKDIEKLKKIHNEIKDLYNDYKVKGNPDMKKLQKLNRLFHFNIYKASKNDYLVNLISNLWDRIFIMIYLIISSPNRLENTIKEHEEILKNLENKDELGIEKALKAHLQISKDILFQMLIKNKDYTK